MASATSGVAKMILQYDWNVETESKAISYLTPMMLFRGVKVFRFGLKNYAQSPILFLIAVDLEQLGLKLVSVSYALNAESESMWKLKEEDIGLGSIQLFKVNLTKQISSTTTFSFRMCLEGTIPEYSQVLSDRLAKDQLWNVASKSENGADVEFVVKDKTFSAHKAILAARSPIFAAEFTKEQQGNDQPVRIKFVGVEPSSVEQFLHFIYTGEPMGTFANEELLKLADDYQLPTLAGLCRIGLEPAKSIQIANVRNKLNMCKRKLPEKVRPDQETILLYDAKSTMFHSDFPILLEGKCTQPIMEIQQQQVFFVDYYRSKPSKLMQSGYVLNLLTADIGKFGMSIDCRHFFCDTLKSKYHQMRTISSKKTPLFQRSATRPINTVKINSIYSIDVKVVNTIDNYYYEMMDTNWMTDFWTAATNKKLTDVEILVGTVKVMEAHRFILSARSPVLKETIKKNETGNHVFTFEEEFDVDTVKHFLNFLYTGSLETFFSESINYKQLFKLATLFEVETQKKICQVADRAPPDVEALTERMLESEDCPLAVRSQTRNNCVVQ